MVKKADTELHIDWYGEEETAAVWTNSTPLLERLAALGFEAGEDDLFRVPVESIFGKPAKQTRQAQCRPAGPPAPDL